MVSTGVAAYNFGSRTIHTTLGINVTDCPRMDLGSYIPALWRNKTVMIINEISMVSQAKLSTIN